MLDYLRIMLAARTANSERGASAVEYGLLIAGIAALIVVVVFAFGDNLTGHLRGHLRGGHRRRPTRLHLSYRRVGAPWPVAVNAHELLAAGSSARSSES